MIDARDIGAFFGLDVGKGVHRAIKIVPTGKAFDKWLPRSESELRKAFGKLTAKHGTLAVVVDQCVSIGSLSNAVAKDTGRAVAGLSCLTVRRTGDLSRRGQDRLLRHVRHRGRRPVHAAQPPARSSWRTRPSPS
ncbi:transposase [Streptomyces sp. NPDC086082]|uniref:IS110 family transposase n=1 Tax=Streptomyces sp. NPDC086082 TaxID=3365750 RepID=UPI003808D4E7